MFVRFKSDYSVNGNGFSATYKTTTGGKQSAFYNQLLPYSVKTALIYPCLHMQKSTTYLSFLIIKWTLHFNW